MIRFVLAFIIFSTTLSSQAQKFSFSFKGIDSSTLRSVLNKVSTTTPSMAKADDIIRELMATGKFQSAEFQILEDGKTLQVRAIAKVIVKSFAFEGASNFDSSKLPIPRTLRAGQPFDKDLFVAYAAKVKKFYTEAGYLNAKVELNLYSKDGLTDVKLTIEEGILCKIKSLNFDTKNLPLIKRLQKIKNTFKGEDYTQKNIDLIKARVRNFLKENRYIRATFAKPIISLSKNQEEAQVTIPLKNDFRYDFFVKGTLDSGFTERDIIRKIKASSLRSDSRPPLDFAKNFVTELYLEKGFANVEIKAKQKTVKKAYRKEIYIDIKENQRVRITKFDISGLISRPTSYYRNFILEHSSNLVQKKYFHKKALEKGIENLIAELRNQGYLKAKVQSTKINPVAKKPEVHVEVQINEGPLTQIQAIRFNGNNSFSELALLKETKLKSQSPLKLKNIEKSLDLLQAFYQSKGFLEMNIKNRNSKVVNYNETHTEATVVYDIHEGPKIKVGSIYVRGNELTEPYVIMREVEFEAGDLLTPELIFKTKSKLERLGFFSTVTIDTVEKNTNISNRTVLIQVSENEPGTLRAGLGLTNELNVTLRGYTAISYDNLYGTGRGISFRAEGNRSFSSIGFTEHALTLGYLEPYLIPKDTWIGTTHGRLVSVWSRDIFSIEGDEVTVLEKLDLNLLAEKQLTDHLRLILGFPRLSLQKEFLTNDSSSSDSSLVLKAGPTLEWDHRDDRFNPKEGFFSRTTVEYAPLEKVKFFKSSTRFSHYLPVYKKKVVFANSIGAGYLKNYGTEGVPAVEAFFLGGQSTIRGFQAFEEHIPQSEQLGLAASDSISDFDLRTDSYFGLIKSEVRFPIYGILHGAVFYDGGFVRVSGFDFEDDYRDSAGFGFHIVTPVGPVNFEIGYKLDRKQELNEEPWQFHFSIGSF